MACGYDSNGVFVCDSNTQVPQNFGGISELNDFMRQNPAQNQAVPFNPTASAKPVNDNSVGSVFSRFSNWLGDGFGMGGNSNTRSLAYDPKLGISEQDYNALNPLDKQKFMLEQGKLDALDNFDWQGWAGVGLSGLDTAMKLGMYPTQKEYMSKTVDALDQNIRNAQENWDARKDARKNYSSAFSRNTY